MALWTPPFLHETSTTANSDSSRYTRMVFKPIRELTHHDLRSLRTFWTDPAITPGSEFWDVAGTSLQRRPRDLRFVGLDGSDRRPWARNVADLLSGRLAAAVAPCTWSRSSGTAIETWPVHWRWVDWSEFEERAWRELVTHGLAATVARRFGAPEWLR